ncbi:MAG: tetratricopeptide repeat protein [bacterium]|nr:tetratricopeptide repeat protein [bacterium]
MDRLTRKELKTDRFAAEVGHTVAFLEKHRREATIAAVAVAVILAAALGFYFYQQGQRAERQALLREALQTHQAQVGAENPFVKTFETEEERKQAIQEDFQKLIDAHPGSDEADIAMFYLGIVAADEGRAEDAEKHLKQVAESGSREYGSQASLSLATIYAGQGRTEEAEKLLRDLIDNPTVLVSKEQATIALAQTLADSNPDEARKLLEPLRGERGAVSRAALTVLGQISGAPQQ